MWSMLSLLLHTMGTTTSAETAGKGDGGVSSMSSMDSSGKGDVECTGDEGAVNQLEHLDSRWFK